MGWPGSWILLMVVASVAGEYTWTGTDWEWQDPEDTSDPVFSGDLIYEDLSEGSAGLFDDEDRDMDEGYNAQTTTCQGDNCPGNYYLELNQQHHCFNS